MDTRLALSWGAYQKNICNGFSYLQQRGEFVDMTLAADGHHVQVHKMVLCLVSPYIKELIATTQCSHPVIFLNNVSKTTLEYILEYIYTGEALVPRDRIKEFLQACNSLNIKGLEQTTQIEQRKELEQNLSEASSAGTVASGSGACTSRGVTKPAEKNDDPIAFDDGGHDDTDFSDNDQVMEISNETNSSPVQTHTNTSAKKPPEITNTIISNTFSGSDTRVQYTKSVHGQLQIILNRYLYCFHYRRNRTDDLVWRCLNNRETKCPATVITKDGTVIRRLKAHNHPFADKTILKRVRKGIVYSHLNEVEHDVMEVKKGNRYKHVQ